MINYTGTLTFLPFLETAQSETQRRALRGMSGT